MSSLLMAILLSFFSFLLIYFLSRHYIKFAIRHNILAPDYSKVGLPKIPRMAGILLFPFIIYVIASEPILAYISGFNLNYLLAFILSGSLGLLVGFIDDLNLRTWEYIKIVSIAIAAIPIIVLQTYVPRPILPYLGRLRLTLVYPLLIFLAFMVVPNGMNMLDLVNGVMLFSQILMVLTICFWTLLLGQIFIFTLSLMYLGALIALFIFNKYPAKYFVSNSGAYGTGAITTALIIFSRLEFVAIILFLPMILNSFSLLATLKGILTREMIREKSNIRKDGLIYPNPNPKAPMNIVRMIVIHKESDEWEVIKVIYALFIFSTILANITAYLIFFAKIL